MTFDFLTEDAAAADILFDVMGETVTYHRITGTCSTVQAIIDRDIESFPTGFDSAVAERRTEISLLKSDAPKFQRGELVVTDTESYELQDLVEDDGVEIRVTAIRQ